MSENSENIYYIDVDGVELEGELIIPNQAPGLVVFAHGSGSSRHSPRNNFVAEIIRNKGLGTLLFDLLTEKEDQDRENRFDISLLTDRLVAVTDWLRSQEDTRNLDIGYFGSSTGAAAALKAETKRQDIDAIVSRGGRVDMASEILDKVKSPTLFIVGGEDTQVLQLNREALKKLNIEKNLEIIEGAGHLFEEKKELKKVSDLATQWFIDHLK